MALRNGAFSMARVSSVLSGRSARSASEWAPARWSEMVRTASKDILPDDPPTAPLHETHEMHEGLGDFSNWLDRHDDTTVPQALTGLGFMLAMCYGVYSVATSSARNSTPAFTLRELPTVEKDIPTFAFDNGDPRATK